MAKEWEIKINDFLGGYAPAYWKTDFPSYGNKNMAGDMKNVNLIDPAFITQGVKMATIDDQTGNVSSLIKSILDKAISSDTTYGVGGNKFYTISSGSVATPHTIDNPSYTGEDAEDLVYFRGNIYYSYNYSGGGDIGKYIPGEAYDDDWGSTVPTGATSLGDHPHPMIASGSFFYVGNGNYVTSYDADNNTLIEKDLDLPQDEVIVSLSLNGNILLIGTNNPNVSGNNKNIGSVYKWDRNAPSWEDDSIIGIGEVGAIWTRNGISWVFHRDESSGVSAIGYISGASIKDVAYFYGSLPSHSQVTEYENFITFVSDNKLYCFGTPDDNKINYYLFQLTEGTLSTVGGIAVPFGKLMIASTDGSTGYDLSFEDYTHKYTTDAYWKSILFDTSEGDTGKSMIDKVIVNFDTLGIASRVDLTFNCNFGTSSTTKEISFSSLGGVSQVVWNPKKEARNFRVELDWSNGSTTNPVKIKNIKIFGHTL